MAVPDVSSTALSPSLDGYAGQVWHALGGMASALFQMDPAGLVILAVVGWFLLKGVLRVLGLLVLTGALEHQVVPSRRERDELLDGMPVRSADPWVRRKRGYR